MTTSSPSSTAAAPVWRPALALAGVSLLGFGLLYSLAGVGLGSVLFPHQAGGSLIERDGKVIGSSLVAQPFADDRYFRSRPSAASYDVMALAGSNQARTNPDLRSRIDEARAAVAARERGNSRSMKRSAVGWGSWLARPGRSLASMIT